MQLVADDPVTHQLAVDPQAALVLASFGVVVEGDTDGAAVMAVILTDDLLTVQLPQPRIMVAAGCDQVRTIGTECTVPDPSLVAGKGGFQRECIGRRIWGRGFHLLHLPDLGRMVGAASC